MDQHLLEAFDIDDDVPALDRAVLHSLRDAALEIQRLPEHPEREFALRTLLNTRNATARLLLIRTNQGTEKRMLAQLLSELGEPPLLRPDDAQAELALLDQVTTEASMRRWNMLTSHSVIGQWVSMLAARARSLGDVLDQDTAFRQMFSRIPAYTRTRPTGFINGLMMRHVPERGSWREDARLQYFSLKGILAAPTEG